MSGEQEPRAPAREPSPPQEAERIAEALDAIADARTWASRAAAELQSVRPIHAAYLRTLETQLEVIRGDLRSGPGDP